MLSKPLFKYPLIVIISFCTMVAAAATGGFSLYWCFPCNIIFYTMSAFLVFKKFGPGRNVFIAVASPLSIEVWLHIKDFNATFISMPNFFAAILGIITGFVVVKAKSKRVKQLYGLAVGIFTAWVFFIGYPLYINKYFYGSFTGRVSENAPKYIFTDSSGTKYEKFNGITVLDFWTTHCGACFQKFPDLEKLYMEHKNEPGVRIFAANLPLGGDMPFQYYTELSLRGYSFPVIRSAEVIDTTLKKFSFTGVPTVIILDRNNKIKYRGDITGADDVVKELAGRQ